MTDVCERQKGEDQMAASTTRSAEHSERDVLAGARATLGQRADVLNVRLGWVFRDGWITDERALVVTVAQKLTPAELHAAGRELLPETFQGLPVEVTGPTPDDLLRLVHGPELARAVLAESAAAAPAIRYVSPTDAKLRRYTARMRVVAHVSPDAGWRELAAFLGPTRRQLIVGMYDFGVRHIVAGLQAVGRRAGFAQLTLVMQKGANVGQGTKRDDLDDAAVVETLGETLAERFRHAWVRIGSVNGWVASSYHIKVAVRDDEAAWLSSGNWQSSNQPPADPLAEQPPDRKWLTRYNREWHVVIEHGGLARTLAAHLRHDYEHNRDTERGVEEALPAWPELLVAEQAVAAGADAAPTWRYFPPYDAVRRFTVRPLLTPDNYHQHVLALVRGAARGAADPEPDVRCAEGGGRCAAGAGRCRDRPAERGGAGADHLQDVAAGADAPRIGAAQGLWFGPGRRQGAGQLSHQGHRGGSAAGADRQPELVESRGLGEPGCQPAV